jgi:hypothetical protein
VQDGQHVLGTRLSLNRLRALRTQRAEYVGEWLPEPLPTEGDPLVCEPAVNVDQRFPSIAYAETSELRRRSASKPFAGSQVWTSPTARKPPPPYVGVAYRCPATRCAPLALCSARAAASSVTATLKHGSTRCRWRCGRIWRCVLGTRTVMTLCIRDSLRKSRATKRVRATISHRAGGPGLFAWK